jgi:hypothetical protein
VSYCQLALRVLLITVFAYSAVGKGHSRAALADFTQELDEFSWLPSALRLAVAFAVIGAEAAATVLLILLPLPGAVLGLVMLGVFTVATLKAGRMTACHCFGSRPVRPGTVGDTGARAFLIRNGLLIAAAAVICVTPDGPLVTAPALAASGCGLSAGLVAVHWDSLAYLLRAPAAGPSSQ